MWTTTLGGDGKATFTRIFRFILEVSENKSCQSFPSPFTLLFRFVTGVPPHHLFAAEVVIMTDSAIEAVFGPVPAGTDLTEDTRSGNNAVVIFLLIIATIATVLRMVARSIARAGIKSDDYVVVAALVRFCSCPALSNHFWRYF